MIEALLSGLKYFKYKILLSIPLGFFVFTEDHQKIITLLICILIIDTILGTIVAIKHKRFASYKMVKFINKIAIYGLALSTAYTVSLLNSYFTSFFYYVGSYIILTEALSNFEKLALLNFKLPLALIKKLNIDFRNMTDNISDKENKELLNKVLNKK